MNTEEILERLRTKIIKGDESKENIEERAEKFKKSLAKGMEKGRYIVLKKIGADLNEVAYILAYTENEKAFAKEVVQKRREYKNYPAFGKKMEKNRMKMRFLERSGKDISFKDLPKEERINKQKELIEKLKKYPESYLDKAILDLGSYFEVMSPPNVKKAEERRQYELIGRLLYDFDLFKQSLAKAEDKGNEDEAVRERVIKRAESISSKRWKEHIEGTKERLEKSVFSPSCLPTGK